MHETYPAAFGYRCFLETQLRENPHGLDEPRDLMLVAGFAEAALVLLCVEAAMRVGIREG